MSAIVMLVLVVPPVVVIVAAVCESLLGPWIDRLVEWLEVDR